MFIASVECRGYELVTVSESEKQAIENLEIAYKKNQKKNPELYFSEWNSENVRVFKIKQNQVIWN